MELVVCFKESPDLDLMGEEDWTVEEGAGGTPRVETGFVRTQINPADEGALEMARSFREDAEEQEADRRVELSALTAGGRGAERFFKTLWALGYDRGIRLVPGAEAGGAELIHRPEAAAAGIAGYIASSSRGGLSETVLVMSSQSPEGGHGKTPFLTAEALGIPCLAPVTGFRPRRGADGTWTGELDVDLVVGGWAVTRRTSPPAVLAVGQGAGGFLRVPPLKARMAAGKREPERIPWPLGPGKGGPGDPAPDVVLTSLQRVDQSRPGRRLPGDTVEERAEALLGILREEGVL